MYADQEAQQAEVDESPGAGAPNASFRSGTHLLEGVAGPTYISKSRKATETLECFLLSF